MSRIFLSHSSKDNFAAVAVNRWLKEGGWDDVFLDVDPAQGLHPGQRWERALYEQASDCEAVLFLISSNWLNSDWCRREFDLARKLNKRILVVLIEGISVGELPDYLKETYQTVSLAAGADHRVFNVTLPVTHEQGHVTFSQEGLQRLENGLAESGLDPRFFAWPPDNDPQRAPYRGLDPLDAVDAGIFFGRDGPIIEVLDILRGLREGANPRLLVVLGASGAGKSSFLRAGLLARLARDSRNFLALPIVRPERAALNGANGFVASFVTFSAGFGPDSDNSARVWELETGHQVALLEPGSAIGSASFSTDGDLIVTGPLQADSKHPHAVAQLWNWRDAERLRTLEDPTFQDEATGWIAFSTGGTRILTAATDGIVRVWDTESGELVASLKGHEKSVERAFYSKEGDRIFTVSTDRTARIWDSSAFTTRIRLVGHHGPINWAEYSSDGALILTASGDGTAKLWDTRSNEELKTLPARERQIEAGRLSPDKKFAVLRQNDGTSVLVNIAANSQIGSSYEDATAGSSCMSFSPDSKKVAICNDRTIKILNVDDGLLYKSLDLNDAVIYVEFSPDGTGLASTTLDARAQLWDVATGKVRYLLEGHRDPANVIHFSPNGKRVITASTDGTARIWDTATGNEIAVLRGHTNIVHDAQFSPDGREILTSSDRLRIFDAESGRLLRLMRGKGLHGRFSPSGRLVVGTDGQNAVVWDPATGTRLAELKGPATDVEMAVFSPDENRVLAVSQDLDARIWDISTIPRRDLFQLACADLADRSSEDLLESTGQRSISPICSGGEPLPEPDAILRMGEAELSSRKGLSEAEYLLFQRQFDRAIGALREVELYGSFQDKLHASMIHAVASAYSGDAATATQLLSKNQGEILFDYFEPDVDGVAHIVFETEALRELAEAEKYLGRVDTLQAIKDQFTRQVAQYGSIGEPLDDSVAKFNNKDVKGAIAASRLAIDNATARDPSRQTPEIQYIIYVAYRNIGYIGKETRDKTLAEASYRSAIAVARALNEKDPDDVPWEFDLMYVLVRAAEFSEDPRSLLTEAETLARALLYDEMAPVLTRWYPTIVETLSNLDAAEAQKLFENGKYKEAYDKYRVAVDRAEFGASNGLTDDPAPSALNSEAWYALFAENFDQALSAANKAIDKTDDEAKRLDPLTNKAHALMFLNRRDEARAIYLGQRGKIFSDKRTWETVIAADFSQLRAAGLFHPLMTEIEADFKRK